MAQYKIFNGPFPTTAAQLAVTTGTAIKTMLQVKGVTGVQMKVKAWGVSMDKPALGIMTPFDGKPATVGNGVMAAIVVDSRDKVDRVYAKAIALGGKDEGAPGWRTPNFYGAYFRDPDGNKLCIACHAPAPHAA